jgi:antitoxin component YwqK of YwqJK toxin-antitoxin module
VVADSEVLSNPAHRKAANRYGQFMRRQTITYLILFSTIFLSCRQENKNVVGNKIEIGDSVIKVSILDTNYFDIARYKKFKDYADIELKTFNEDEFNFTNPTKTYEIYNDRSFSHMVGKITFALKDSMVTYQMFDLNGNLRLNYAYINIAHFYGKRKSWYPNKTLEKVETYNDNGSTLSDSSFFENGKLNEILLYTADTLYKEMHFYKTGNIKEETYNYRGFYPKDHRTDTEYSRVFVINYDSLTQKPSMFYSTDKIWEDKNNPGTYVCSRSLLPVDQAVIIKKK